MKNTEFFTNDRFFVLTCLYDVRDRNNIARITQREVAEELGLSRITMNAIFKQLKEAGYIEHDSSHMSRYLLTERAIGVVEGFRVVDKKFNQ